MNNVPGMLNNRLSTKQPHLTLHLPVMMHSALKCRLQIKILLLSIRVFRSGVISCVHKIRRSHSLRAFLFKSFVCSPSESGTFGGLNSDSLCFSHVRQPKKAQLLPPIYLQQLFAIDFKIPAQ